MNEEPEAKQLPGALRHGDIDHPIPEQSDDLHPELQWPSSDVLVSYDSEHEQIHYTAISTGESLMIWDLKTER